MREKKIADTTPANYEDPREDFKMKIWVPTNALR